MKEKDKLFIGIDLNHVRAMVSFYHEGMREPETVSTVPGEEHFRIPTSVFCSEQGQYFYGEEADRRRDNPDGAYFSNLYEQALDPDNVVYRNMLVSFLRRLVRFSEQYDEYELTPFLAVTVPEIDESVVALFAMVQKELGFTTEYFRLMDYSESFFSYVYSLDATIYRHDVAMFDYEKEHISYILLHADTSGEIRRVTATQEDWDFPGYLEGQKTAMDEFFSNIVREAFEKSIISGVFFVGEGFDGGWLNTSLRMVGPNKRVFKGKNLYTVGACYAIWRSLHEEDLKFYFDCPYKLQGEISLQVLQDGEPTYLRLTQLGENWFLPTEKYYFLYDGNPTLETWTRVRQRMNAKQDSFILEFMPERSPRSIRLCVQAFPLNGREVVLKVMDDGFGELYESSGKVWEFPILM